MNEKVSPVERSRGIDRAAFAVACARMLPRGRLVAVVTHHLPLHVRAAAFTLHIPIQQSRYMKTNEKDYKLTT